MTGLCAYALAFSTLLSSQGADAHRHKAFAWIGGNRLIIPASSRAVKRLDLTLTTSQPRVLPAYPAADRPDVRIAHPRGVFLGWLLARDAWPAFTSCLGADERLGIQAIHVKSRARESRTCRSAASGCQPMTTSAPPTVRRPRRSTRNRPCSSSAASGTASSAVTL